MENQDNRDNKDKGNNNNYDRAKVKNGRKWKLVQFSLVVITVVQLTSGLKFNDAASLSAFYMAFGGIVAVYFGANAASKFSAGNSTDRSGY